MDLHLLHPVLPMKLSFRVHLFPTVFDGKGWTARRSRSCDHLQADIGDRLPSLLIIHSVPIKFPSLRQQWAPPLLHLVATSSMSDIDVIGTPLTTVSDDRQNMETPIRWTLDHKWHLGIAKRWCLIQWAVIGGKAT